MAASTMLTEVTAWLAGRLVSGSLECGLLVALVWLILRRADSVPPRARALMWWLVGLKIVLTLAPVPALRLPVLPPPTTPVRQVASLGGERSLMVAMPIPIVSQPSSVQARHEPSSWTRLARVNAAVSWVTVLAAFWLLGVVAQAAWLLRVHRRVRRVVSRAVRVDDEAWVPIARMASRFGLRRVPELRVTPEVETPQVVGLVRPVILLPSECASFTPEERAMAVGHELAHVRRGDLLLGWIPALAERLFFFHPLARLAAREYLVAREAACDAAVVRALDAEPADYGRLLVRLGVVRSEPGFSAAGSSTSSSCLRRRLAMLDQSGLQGRSRVVWLVIAALALLALPLRVVARSPETAAGTSVVGAGTTVAAGEWSGAQPASGDDSHARPLGDQPAHALEQRPRAQAARQTGVPAAPTTAAQEADRAAATVQLRRAIEEAARRLEAEQATVRGDAQSRAAQDLAIAQQQMAEAQQSRASAELLQRADSLNRREIELAKKLQSSNPERMKLELELRALQQELAKMDEAIARQRADRLGASQRRLEELSRGLTKESSSDSLVQQVERLRQVQADIARERQGLVEQQRRLAEYERQLSDELNRLLEQMRGKNF